MSFLTSPLPLVRFLLPPPSSSFLLIPHSSLIPPTPLLLLNPLFFPSPLLPPPFRLTSVRGPGAWDEPVPEDARNADIKWRPMFKLQ